jgi:hypothetical protein
MHPTSKSQSNKRNKEHEVNNNSSKKILGRRAAHSLIPGLLASLAMLVFAGIASAQDTRFFVSTGNTDGKLGALSRRPSAGKVETETADDFVLNQTTVINGATITGLISPATSFANITDVEVEIYHRFPEDSANPDPLGGKVPTRLNSPSDVEIESATRDSKLGTLRFAVRLLNANASAQNSVKTGIFAKPNSTTHGDLSVTGEEVQIAITFTKPIVLPAGHYFFRPEVLVTAGGDFLFLSAPKPIVAPGTAIAGDLQAWIRNSNLSPDWLRIGTDIINNTVPPPAFNMTFSLAGNIVPGAGSPRQANCDGTTISALAREFGSIDAAAAVLGFSSVQALEDSFRAFCE